MLFSDHGMRQSSAEPCDNPADPLDCVFFLDDMIDTENDLERYLNEHNLWPKPEKLDEVG